MKSSAASVTISSVTGESVTWHWWRRNRTCAACVIQNQLAVSSTPMTLSGASRPAYPLTWVTGQQPLHQSRCEWPG